MDYSQCMEIVEEVMEWIALRWSNSQIKRELREWFPDITSVAASFLISAAKKEIRKRYNIQPQEYKGRQIAFYEWVIRSKNKTRDKLTAAERLDKLFGLENVDTEDAESTAHKIRKAINEINDEMFEGDIGDVTGNKSEGDGKTNAEGQDTSSEPASVDILRDGQQEPSAQASSKPAEEANIDAEDIIEPATIDQIPQEVIEELKLKEGKTLNEFIKRHRNQQDLG